VSLLGEDGVLRYTPPETLRRFMLDDSKMRVVMGPFGSGKTSACVMEVLRRASMQEPGRDGYRRSRFAVVRQTVRQLKDTTVKTFLEWLPEGEFGVYRRTMPTSTYFLEVGDIRCEVMFRALDDAGDVRNLLSLELTGAYLNECKDISREIVEALHGRVGRYPSSRDGGPTWYGIWCDTNPPVVGSWWWAMMEGIDPEDGVTPRGNSWAVYKQPSGRSAEAENLENLQPDYYSVEGRSAEYVRMFVDGDYGHLPAGQPVHGGFRSEYHVGRGALGVLRSSGYPLVVGMDLGLTPACVYCQMDMSGRALVLDEDVSFGMGAQRFVRMFMKPKLYRRFGGMRVLVVCDPAGVQRAGTDERSVVDVLRGEGLDVVPARTNKLAGRVAAVDDYLMRQVDGGAALLLDPRCVRLKAALMGGYRHHKVTGKLEKTPESHVAEALQYAMLHINTRGGSELVGRVREVLPRPAAWWA